MFEYYLVLLHFLRRMFLDPSTVLTIIGIWEFARRTIMEKSHAPFSLGGDNLKRYFGQR